MGKEVYFLVSPYHPSTVDADGLVFKLGSKGGNQDVEIQFNPDPTGGVPPEARVVFDLGERRKRIVSTRSGQFEVTLQALGEAGGIVWYRFDVLAQERSLA